MGWVSSFENVPSGRRRCYPMRKAIRPAALSRAAGRPCVVADPRHVWKLHAREPATLISSARTRHTVEKPTCSHVGGEGAERLHTITEFSQLSDHTSGAVALGLDADRRSMFFVVYALVQNLPDLSAEAMGNRPDGLLIGEPRS